MWHRGVERGAVALNNAWRRAGLRQSNVRRQREASEFVRYLRVCVCVCVFFALLLLFLFVFFLRYNVGESGLGPAPVFIFGHASPCVCLSHYYFLFDCCPASLPPSFLFCCMAHSLSLSLSLSSYPGCLTLLIWLPFFRSLLRRIFSCPMRIVCGRPLYISLLFVFCILIFSSESLPGDDALYGLLSRPLPSVCFLP